MDKSNNRNLSEKFKRIPFLSFSKYLLEKEILTVILEILTVCTENSVKSGGGRATVNGELI